MCTACPTWTRGVPCFAAHLLAATVLLAAADCVPSGGGSCTGLPMFRECTARSCTAASTHGPPRHPGASQDILDGTGCVGNTNALSVATGGGTRNAGGATSTGSGWTPASGFMAPRDSASIAVANAQSPDDDA
jgi:hypothetical protein